MLASKWSKLHMGMGQNPGTPGEPQNSWDLWMFITLKMVLIGIDPYPYAFQCQNVSKGNHPKTALIQVSEIL